MPEEIDSDAVNTSLLLDIAVRDKLRSELAALLRENTYSIQVLMDGVMRRAMQDRNHPLHSTIERIVAQMLSKYVPGFSYDAYKSDLYRDGYYGSRADRMIADEFLRLKETKKVWR